MFITPKIISPEKASISRKKTSDKREEEIIDIMQRAEKRLPSR
jgi:hypothetical protein